MSSVFDSVPHRNVIVENGEIKIPSIFMFNGGSIELFSFLGTCKEKNCTVHFENEDITVLPKDNAYQMIVLSVYATIAAEPKIAEQYINYVHNLSKMKWEE